MISNLKTHLRRNELGIQMIPHYLRENLFGNQLSLTRPASRTKLEESKYHLSKHNLWKKKISNYENRFYNSKNVDQPMFPIPDTQPPLFNMPPLQGKNVEEHFYNIGKQYSEQYKALIDRAIYNKFPEMPTEWQFKSGWTKYELDNQSGAFISSSVDHPEDNLLFFDVEVCLEDGNFPTLAVALSPTNWYSWCSERLINENPLNDLSSDCESKVINVNSLIPLGENFENERLVIGHNVGFDRSFIREQYNIRNDKLKFLDTLSMHVSLSGLTGYQRALFFSYNSALRNNETNSSIIDRFAKDGHPDPSLWTNTGSLNSLKDVYKFHCGKELSKESRDLFVKGSMNDVRENFQKLVQYCALDTFATYEVFETVWKQFIQKFPHPISLAGTLEMSSTYLPVHINNWSRYLENSQQTYDDLQRELSLCLIKTVNDACRHNFKKESYKINPWLWNLDWSTCEVKESKAKSSTDKISKTKKDALASNSAKEDKETSQPVQLNKQSFLYPYFTEFDEELIDDGPHKFESEFLANIKTIKSQKASYLIGYPKWYRELCVNPFSSRKDLDLDDWQPGPFLASTQIRNIPKLLNLTWKGFALHYQTNESWGYLIPNDLDANDEFIDGFPYREYIKLLKNKFNSKDSCDMELLNQNIEMYRQKKQSNIEQESTERTVNKYTLERKLKKGIEMFGCTFYRLPHKDGIEFKVGNPLSKGFMQHLQDGLLGSSSNENANKVLQLSKALSYWKMTGKRITTQMVCKLDEEKKFGALLPRIIVAGTITRRAVEQTWLTASNAYEDRTGSELKAMIQAPDGYKFVGADVDSQELWIASLLGDSNFAKTHGCTALGWMTLQGTKSNGTDMHSKVASLIGITRDQAKILNYGRIYGAGKAFAARFLKQSNPGMSEEEARQKAETIYSQTKGRKTSEISLFAKKNPFLKSDHMEDQLTQKTTKKWVGGSESHMFNMLEEIARKEKPETPVLNCSISTSLSNEQVKKDFITSVINWVVQSSGVDYLHLMLVSMDHLKKHYNLDGRFSISIHDEVRYLFKEEDQFKAAFALQITNLLTRAMFCSRMGMFDVPMSVAFFSSVDIDKVMRKEVNLDCRTLSNPHGLRIGYNIPFGESLNMNEIVEKQDVQQIARFIDPSIDDQVLEYMMMDDLIDMSESGHHKLTI